jgi:hypothetical protein
MVIDPNLFCTKEKLSSSPICKITKSDTVPSTVGGKYPRGFIVITGGSLTVWTIDNSNPLLAAKLDIGTVENGFTWLWGCIIGIADTNEAGGATTADNIIALP